MSDPRPSEEPVASPPSATVPPAPATPPTTVGYVPPPPRQSVWPTVLGIISIIWGGLGTLGWCSTGVFALIWKPYMGFLTSNMPANQGEAEMFEKMRFDDPLILVCAVLGLLLSIWLIVAGVYLIKRRPEGPRWCRIYSLLYIPIVVGYAFFYTRMQMGLFETLPDAPRESANIMAVFTAVLTFLFYAAWPVFLLIWLSRSKIKTEVAGWNAET